MMRDTIESKTRKQTRPADSGPGFARRRTYGLANAAWRDTVTDYLPEPWLVAVTQIEEPLRPGHRPAANR
jgi:hypothetical protein